jgi:K+/H+ antiporter YhaU regulatory subunit KhtT
MINRDMGEILEKNSVKLVEMKTIMPQVKKIKQHWIGLMADYTLKISKLECIAK